MKKGLILIATLVAAGVLSGCDPAPSTKLAPDQPMPDTSKMSQADIEKLHNAGSAAGANSAGSQPVVDHATGNTPPDRMGAPGG